MLFISKILTNKHLLLIIVLIFAGFLSFWKLGQHPLEEWDESRRGMNALGMIKHHDYINLHYGEEYDTWSAKPPLMIWSIITSYHLWGYNEFALRFPSAVSVIIFFLFAYKLTTLYKKPLFGFFVCLMLMSCKGIIGFHVGRSGDTDALLTCLLTISIFYFLRYHDFHHSRSIYISALFFGLAFYTKGFAAFLIVPGIFLYSILRRRILQVLRDRNFLSAFLLTTLIISSWIILLKFYGAEHPPSLIPGKNTLEKMVLYDLIHRFFHLNEGQQHEWFFFFPAVDITFNIWNYIMYLAISIGLYKIYKNRKNLWDYLGLPQNRLILFSACISSAIVILLSLSANKKLWYFAPYLLFFAVITCVGMMYLSSKYKWINYLWMLIFIFTLTRHFIELDHPKEDHISDFLKDNKEILSRADEIITIGYPPQNVFLYLHWSNDNVHVENQFNADNITYSNHIVFMTRSKLNSDLFQTVPKLEKCAEPYCLITLNLNN